LKELLRQYEQQNIGPLFLYINSRKTPVCSPDEVSKALVSKLDSQKIERIKKSIGRNRFISLLTSLKIKVRLSSSLPFFKSDLEAELAKELKEDQGNLESTINKFDKILEALEPLPRKPVIVIGTMQTSAESSTEFSAMLLIFFNFYVPLQLTLANKYVTCR
jgi:hypothetical protein